ncbi:MAG TPA: hypothetical protein VK658_15630 [Chryseolinea sp.]|nr:hypothetical protein [Chryseolinea sp.]
MRLSEDQVNLIRSRLQNGGMQLSSLQEDVLDHLCCVLEHGDSSLDFEERLEDAIKELAPNGLSSLERETLFLLSHKRLIYMKKIMYLVGLGSSISLAMGLCFKLLNWPGGDQLIVYGFLSFTLLFLPMMTIDRFKVKIQKSLSDKLRFALGSISALLAGVAVLLKMLHLSGGDHLLLIAAVVFSFGFLPFLFFTNYRKAVEQHF